MDLIIKNGTVVTSQGARPGDVGVEDGRIVSLDVPAGIRAGEVVDARGCYVLPGGIDPHVHFELPAAKATSSDTFVTGSEAALCGGVTSFVDFALFDSNLSLPERLALRREAAEGRASADYSLHLELGAVDTKRLEEIRDAALSGQRSFKTYMAFDDPDVRVGEAELRQFAEVLARARGMLTVHAEDGEDVLRREADLLSAGRVAPVDHPRARPAEVEVKAIDTVLGVAHDTGVEVYIVHVSSAAGLERIRDWRARGVRVWAETCPHYLLLTEEVYGRDDGVQFLANPPLKKTEDVEALWHGVRDGSINTIATDHCPFTRVAKMRYHGNFMQVPKGLAGVETRLPLMYSEGVVKRGISVERLVDLLSSRPANIFGLAATKGEISAGRDADLVVFDPRRETILSATGLHMNADFVPFEGMVVQGWPAQVFLRGRRVYRDGIFLGREGEGRYLGPWKRQEKG